MENQENPNLIFSARIFGGVGNQLFQIAIAFAFAKKYKSRLIFEKKVYGEYRIDNQGCHPSKYYSTLYKKLEFVDWLNPRELIDEKTFLAYDVQPEVASVISRLNTFSLVDSLISKQNENPLLITFGGHWQSVNYFKDCREDVKKLFTPNEGIVEYLKKNTTFFEKFPELMEDNDFCFIGVRRGDYIKHVFFHNPCGFHYYSTAMSIMNKKRYYIASDDYEWCKRKFVGEQYRFLEVEDDLIQLYVTGLFKNYIISNSTFHWWGSFFTIYENPFIIAPDKWAFSHGGTLQEYYTIYRPEMNVLERPVEID
jgi:hypothetical protein